MSDKPASNNSTAAWIISIVAALVFYVLSYGPVMALAEMGTTSRAAMPLLRGFYQPISWVTDMLHLQDEEIFYLEKWYDRLN